MTCKQSETVGNMSIPAVKLWTWLLEFFFWLRYEDNPEKSGETEKTVEEDEGEDVIDDKKSM